MTGDALRLLACGLLATGAAVAGCAALNKLKGGRRRARDGSRRVIYVGTRKSPLAMVQTRFVVAQLQRAHPDLDFEIVQTETKGDKILDKPLAKIGDKGLFTQELERQMYDGRIDIAVHSCKDLQTTLPPGLCIGAFLRRHEREDVFIVSQALAGSVKSVAELPPGSVVGTSSLRRRAMLAHKHPHLEFKDIRGNIGTRLGKLDDPANGYAATILAHAGLSRMNTPEYTSRLTQVLPEAEYMYAVAQGVIAVECREDDDWIRSTVLAAVNHPPTQQDAEAERGLLRGLEGGCHVPLSCRCTRDGAVMRLEGAVLALDGSQCVRDAVTGDPADATELGHSLARKLASSGAKELLAALHTQS